MTHEPGYLKAFYFALGLHLAIFLILFTESTSSPAVLQLDARAQVGEAIEKPQSEPVKAVTVDQREIQETITRIKEERARKEQQETARQERLEHQIKQAKEERLKEQQRLKQLKEEVDKVALARKKQIEEEKRRLKQLAEEKEKESKRLAELKKQKETLQAQQDAIRKKQEEEKRLAELNKKKAEQEAETKRLAAAEREKSAREAAARQAQIAGEVNKYKALIVNAISRQWILPENVDSSLSSQFRIRLAPDGMVLDVHLIRSSGDSVLDRSAQTAIFKASPLPVPTETEAFNLFRDISLTVRPEQVRG